VVAGVPERGELFCRGGQARRAGHACMPERARPADRLQTPCREMRDAPRHSVARGLAVKGGRSIKATAPPWVLLGIVSGAAQGGASG
jgi:hypothetical protein